MSDLKLIPLGGIGQVTQNLFVYEYDNEILLVDCGIGFPDVYTPGVDAIIPDISYLQRQVTSRKKIVALIFSHGHDDHTAAIPYILPELPDFPLYASKLTAGFVQLRLLDKGIDKQVKIIADRQQQSISKYFAFELINVTHSVPDTKHILIETPIGKIYHGSDFKLDPNPIDGRLTDVARIAELKNEQILLMLIDCLRVERESHVKSESTVGPALEREILTTRGKVFVTLMSSHLHRIQQIIDIAKKIGRKIVFVGRSVEQNVEMARNLKMIDIPNQLEVDKKEMDNVADEDLIVIIAGSQGQEGSSLTRAAFGDHPTIQIKKQDKVIFSADVIPGNELPYYNAVNELASNDIDVVYPDILPAVHQSGHASAAEQQELVSLVKPKFLMPIGGADRHRALFKKRVASKLGYGDRQVLIPKTGQILAVNQQSCQVTETIKLKPQIIDGLGIGDVGPVVISDRLALSKAGIVVVVIPRRAKSGQLDLENISVVSRGFVFMRQSQEVIDFIQDKTAEIIRKAGRKTELAELKRLIERKLSRKLYKILQREPMIVPVVVEV